MPGNVGHDRVPPRDKAPIDYRRPSVFHSHMNHYFGYRIHELPFGYAHHHYHGCDFYFYDGIWYRPFGVHYVVCRPPFGYCFEHAIHDMALTAIRMSYYQTLYHTYDKIDENNAYIAEQNEQIARNNALIAEQNAQIAMNSAKATESYGLANRLGLIQSYASASMEYYYEDGVFYTLRSDGQYVVIVPPVGALVEALPEDFELVTLADGKDYYMVDDTVYRVVVSDGKAYFEVLGQIK